MVPVWESALSVFDSSTISSVESYFADQLSRYSDSNDANSPVLRSGCFEPRKNALDLVSSEKLGNLLRENKKIDVDQWDGTFSGPIVVRPNVNHKPRRFLRLDPTNFKSREKLEDIKLSIVHRMTELGNKCPYRSPIRS